MLIWPEASSAQNNIAAVSADGSTVWVLIRRLRSRVSHCWRQAWQGAADQTDFHSFRRAVATQLREAEVQEADVAAILGHEHCAETFGTYGKAVSLTRLAKIVSKIQYDGLKLSTA
jgi:integrase